MAKKQNEILSEGLHEFIWDNVHHCMFCRTPCHGNPPGKDVVILGKEVKSLCRGRPLVWVFDPDETAIVNIKRLIELEINERNL